MSQNGYIRLIVSEDVFEQLVAVMSKYDCASVADVIDTASTIALEPDEAEFAQILAD